jgi:hypothetical protein
MNNLLIFITVYKLLGVKVPNLTGINRVYTPIKFSTLWGIENIVDYDDHQRRETTAWS